MKPGAQLTFDLSQREVIEHQEQDASLTGRPQKITFAEMRSQGVRGLLVFCQDYRCSHNVTMSGDRWPDDLRLSDIEDRFICTACGKRGADIRGDPDWDKPAP